MGSKCRYFTRVQPRLDEIEAWAASGLTQCQIAKNLNIASSTFKKYKAMFIDLSDALEKGSMVAIAYVENMLFKRALGYEYEESKTYVKENDDGTKTTYNEVTRKHMPADVAACIILLKNKDRPNWSNDPMRLALEREKFEWAKQTGDLSAGW